MDKNMFQDRIAPALALVMITFVTCIALVGTYVITKPIIDKNIKREADLARTQVLPKGDKFKESDKKLSANINAYHISDNGEGVVVTSVNKSFGGDIVVMTGISKEGKITGVKVTEHSDTPGLGTKAQMPDYIDQFKKKDKLGADSVKKDADIDAVVGATISSDAVYGAVKKALDEFSKQKGGSK